MKLLSYSHQSFDNSYLMLRAIEYSLACRRFVIQLPSQGNCYVSQVLLLLRPKDMHCPAVSLAINEFVNHKTSNQVNILS